MNYAVEMGSGAMINIPSFISNGSDIQKLLGRDTDIKTAQSSHKPTLGKRANHFFFLNLQLLL
jgi:hypothetical protein